MCYDPNCPMCSPQAAARALGIAGLDYSRRYILNFGGPNAAEEIANVVKKGLSLDEIEKGVAVAKEKAAKEQAEAEERAKTVTTLKGVAELAKKRSTPRRFILAYSSDESCGTVEGIVYTKGNVEVEDCDALSTEAGESMSLFLDELKGDGYVTHVLYLD